MHYNIWQGQRVRLRAIEPGDWEVFHANDADSEAARLGYCIPLPRSAAASQTWAEGEAKQAQSDNMRFAIETLDRELVGTINTTHCNPHTGTFGYGVAIFRPHWRKGYAREAILLVVRYYFHELRYQKVTTSVYDFNDASLALHQSLGFVQEGRLRRMGFTGGTYFDEIVVGMTREEFEVQQSAM
jgi:RimJ/RimL family protein N-acetyltransferase